MEPIHVWTCGKGGNKYTLNVSELLQSGELYRLETRYSAMDDDFMSCFDPKDDPTGGWPGAISPMHIVTWACDYFNALNPSHTLESLNEAMGDLAFFMLKEEDEGLTSDFKYHAAKVLNANLYYPILIGTAPPMYNEGDCEGFCSNAIVDGLHRCAKNLIYERVLRVEVPINYKYVPQYLMLEYEYVDGAHY